MELPEIEKLLNKYFEGKTSISEETLLRTYFTTGDVVPHLEEYKNLFRYFEDEHLLTSELKEETYDRKTLKHIWIGIAASITLIFGIFFTYHTVNKTSEDLGTYENPEIALQKTKKILNIVSQYMNEGTKELIYLNEFENTSKKIIQIK